MSIRKLETSTSLCIKAALTDEIESPIWTTIDEIVLCVLDSLSSIQCSKFALVCKQFHQLVESSHVYKDLFVRFVGLKKPEDISYKAFLLQKAQEENPQALLALLYYKCSSQDSDDLQKNLDLIEKLDKLELSKKQQLELILCKADLYIANFWMKPIPPHMNGLFAECLEFFALDQEGAEKKYKDYRKTRAELYYYQLKLQINNADGQVMSQNLLLDPAHRSALQVQIPLKTVVDASHLKMMIHNPRTQVFQRNEAIELLAILRTYRIIDAISDQEIIVLLDSIAHNKKATLASQLLAKTYQGILCFKAKIEKINARTLTEWFTDIQTLAHANNITFPELDHAAVYKCIIQFSDKTLDIDTANKLIAFANSPNTQISTIAILYLAIMIYENRIAGTRNYCYSLLQSVESICQQGTGINYPRDALLKAKLYMVLMHVDNEIEVLHYTTRYGYLQEIATSPFADPEDVLKAKLQMVKMHEQLPLEILSIEEQYAFVEEVATNQFSEPKDVMRARLYMELLHMQENLQHLTPIQRYKQLQEIVDCEHSDPVDVTRAQFYIIMLQLSHVYITEMTFDEIQDGLFEIVKNDSPILRIEELTAEVLYYSRRYKLPLGLVTPALLNEIEEIHVHSDESIDVLFKLAKRLPLESQPEFYEKSLLMDELQDDELEDVAVLKAEAEHALLQRESKDRMR